MRLIPVNKIEEGSILAKNIYDNRNTFLLKKGAVLNNHLIKKLTVNGIYYVYIEDEFSDTEIKDIVSPEIRKKAVDSIKETFTYFNQYNDYKENCQYSINERSFIKKRNEHLENLTEISKELIDDISKKENIVVSLVDIKNYDDYTYQHCINVAVLSMVAGIELNLSNKELKDLSLGAMLHDIGKTFIPKEILNKDGKLSDKEFDIMKKHSLLGYEYLKDCSWLSSAVKIIALQHHEKVNGSGYPKGLKGKKIYKLAKIVSVADVYDALTSNRPYRKPIAPNEALEYLYANGGEHFDYDIVKTFSKKIIPYPVGSLVTLSNGETAVVKKVTKEFSLRPIITILSKNKKRTVNLIKEKNLVITGLSHNL
ncbi:MAG: HD-GYP domain-containing protein [Firmicutes bacterium]|nr:HD-GYP domain-containing protein [Bacillota bacterium]